MNIATCKSAELLCNIPVTALNIPLINGFRRVNGSRCVLHQSMLRMTTLYVRSPRW